MKRLEIGVLPATVNADGQEVAVNAATRTFDLKSAKFDDKAFSADRRNRQVRDLPRGAGDHLPRAELRRQRDRVPRCATSRRAAARTSRCSRASLDSYVHAIHSMQDFDVVEHRLQGPGPGPAVRRAHDHAVPDPRRDQLRVLPLPRARTKCRTRPRLCRRSCRRRPTNETWDRNIGTVPSVVTGPATTACGGCHRAQLINEDKAGGLAVLNQHFTQAATRSRPATSPVDTWTGHHQPGDGPVQVNR